MKMNFDLCETDSPKHIKVKNFAFDNVFSQKTFVTNIVEYLKSVNIPSSWGQCLCASLADVCLCNGWKGAKMFQRVNYLHL